MRRVLAAIAVLCVLPFSLTAAEKPKEHQQKQGAPGANDPDAAGFSAAVRKAIRAGLARTPSPTETPTDRILSILRGTDNRKTEGTAYRLTTGNQLPEGWIIQSPNWWGKSVNALPVVQPCTAPHCDADFKMPHCNTNVECESPTGCATVNAMRYYVDGPTPWKLCVGHSDLLMDKFYQRIVDAKESVEFSTLGMPTGRFLTALQYGIAYLADSRRPIRIRIIIGIPFLETAPSPRETMETFIRFAHLPHSQIRVAVAIAKTFDDSWYYWNHSKIMSNEREAVVGGHNLYMGDYLLTAPVHDLSMRVIGPAATTAQRFLDPIWLRYGCPNLGNGVLYDGKTNKIEDATQTNCHWPSSADAPAGGTTKILSVGNYSRSVYKQDVPTYMADVARVAAFGMAKDTIKIAQQDIGYRNPGLWFGLPYWPEETLDALMDAALRGVHVYIVHSNLDAVSGAGVPYSNGITPKQLVAELKRVAAGRPGRPKGDKALVDKLCEKVHLAPLRFTNSDTWPGKIPPALHAKLWVVDDKLFYIGSDNIYPAWLYEFGYIVDGATETSSLVEGYWNVLWDYSKKAAYSGKDAPRCEFR